MLRRGTIDFNCFAVSGCASGSALAAALIARPCTTVGMTTDGRLETLDIVLYLASIGPAQADDSSRLATVYERYVVQDIGLRRELRSIAARRTRSGRRTIPAQLPSRVRPPRPRTHHASLGWLRPSRDRTRFARFIVATVMRLVNTAPGSAARGANVCLQRQAPACRRLYAARQGSASHPHTRGSCSREECQKAMTSSHGPLGR